MTLPFFRGQKLMTGWGLGEVGSKYWEILMTSFMLDPLAGYVVSYVVVAIYYSNLVPKLSYNELKTFLKWAFSIFSPLFQTNFHDLHIENTST